MRDLISVIIPVYNKEKYLKKCVDSLIEQSYSNIEIILVNDGSVDRSPQICDDYAFKDSRIKVIHRENGGVSAARNAGIENANGKYLMFVDSDDWVASNFCEEAYKAIIKNCSDICVFGFYNINEKDSNTITTIRYKNELLDNIQALKENLKNNIQNYVWNKIYNASLFSKIRFVEGKVWEDLEIMYRLILQSKSVAFCDKCTYFYQKNNSSITKNITAKSLEDIFTIRYARHSELCDRGYEDIANLAFGEFLLSALNLYDRSLKEEVRPEILLQAIDFLNDNSVMAQSYGIKFKLYFKVKLVYDIVIKSRQAVGKIWRFMVSKIKTRGR